ncbi:orotidine 5'-phosphate decarboxylase active site [Lucifera butyrica]|uniref:Orotidine 5'-phosphate decarboxylase n=1 Tax=Lucifera butyrica TaxID=1351585 RepID=A0A498R556_9FIRM|nr:orotidine-5'-phosphate decarboxylase [Lucifera butyrica]VBB06279.1 orotidine 5'-phosphate decarboxylase active site [Lucifera butyrica]
MNDKRLIVALDVATMAKARALVDELGDSVTYYKVGMELFYSVGGEIVRFLRNAGKEVFLDLKLHDIPNTVAQGTARLTRLGASILNVHAAGGRTMMRAAAIAVTDAATTLGIAKPKLIAITILTSMDREEWTHMHPGSDIAGQVQLLARMAQEAGLDGVVASPQEAGKIRAVCGQDFLIVTPGIRPQGAALNDQSRTATPEFALSQGADYIVVGRPITKADNPREAAEQILQEMRRSQ